MISFPCGSEFSGRFPNNMAGTYLGAVHALLCLFEAVPRRRQVEAWVNGQGDLGWRGDEG